MPSHRFEIMLLTYNRRGIVARCLQSLMPVLRRDNVAWSVLDNCSTDGTAQWLLTLRQTLDNPRFKLYLGTQNTGVSGGRDFLLKQADARADIWVFLDSDVIARNDQWLDKLADVLDSNPAIGLTGPAGHWITTNRDGSWRWFEPVAPTFQGDVDTVSGYCQAMRRTAMDGFEMDLAYGRYFLEDTDTCLWLRSRGYTTWCSGDIGVQHLYSNSANDDSGAQKMQYMSGKWRGKHLIRAERE